MVPFSSITKWAATPGSSPSTGAFEANVLWAAAYVEVAV